MITKPGTKNPSLEAVARALTETYGFVHRTALDDVDKWLKLDDVDQVKPDGLLQQEITDRLWVYYTDRVRSEMAAIRIVQIIA